VMLLFEQVVQAWGQTAFEVEALASAASLPVGARLAFSESFYTKNLAGKSSASEPRISGDLALDPHVWTHAGQVRAYLPLDTRWITTSTARSTFRAGRAHLAGLGILRASDSNRILISPLALGMPVTPENEWFYGR